MNATLSPRTPKRRPSTRRARAPSHLPPILSQESHDAALYAIRIFLKGRTCYDAFPVSFRLIVLDTKLNVKKALQCLLLNGAPSHISPTHTSYPHRRRLCSPMEQRKVKVRWHAHRPRHHPSHPVLLRQSQLRGCSRRRRDIPARVVARYVTPRPSDEPRSDTLPPEIEKSLGVATPPMLKDHPNSTLYDAAKVLIQTHARRLPLLDYDSETGHEVIVSVLTQYRLLKFISINVIHPFCLAVRSYLYLPVHQGNTTAPSFPSQT